MIRNIFSDSVCLSLPLRVNTAWLKADWLKAVASLLGIFFLMQVTGCAWLFGGQGYFRDRAEDYKGAESQARILVPDNILVRPVSPKFEVPGGKPDPERLMNDVPKPTTSVLYEYGTRLKRVNDSERLIFQPAPKHLPAILEEYLATSQLELNPKLSDEKIWVTLWGSKTDANDSRGFWSSLWHWVTLGPFRTQKQDYYRFKFEWGERQANETFFDIAYQIKTAANASALPGDYSGDWLNKSSEDSQVAGFLSDLVTFVDDYRITDQNSIQNKGEIRKSIEVDGNGYPILSLSQGYAQAWEDIMVSLLKSEIKIEDLDRSLGLFFVKVPQQPSQLPETDEALSCQIRVARVETGVLVSVQETAETLVPKTVSSQVINTIYENYP